MEFKNASSISCKLNILYNNYDYRKNYLSIYITSTEPTPDCCPKATEKK